MINLYRDPIPQEFLLIGADPAEGGDNGTFVVLAKRTADVVMVGRSKSESSQLGHELNAVGKWLEKKTGVFPSIGVERNTGSATIYVLKDLNYPNLFRMPSSFTHTVLEASENIGWSTNSATRPKMLDDLALAIRTGVIKIPCKDIIAELYSFVRNKRTGKPEADVGSHDDLVMALAIAWQLYQVEQTPLVDFDMARWNAQNDYDMEVVNRM